MAISETEAQARKLFARDIATHRMQIIRDDGAYRHIHFRQQDGCSSDWFDLVTWPGVLCINGDHGTFVFARLTDMFEFFRTDRRDDSGGPYINLGYWSEKLLASDGQGGRCGRSGDSVEEWSFEIFAARINERVDEYIESHGLDEEQQADLREQVQDEILDVAESCGEECAMNEVHRFVFNGNSKVFPDFWETCCREYTHHFIWCCLAIAWGIQQYDESKKGGSHG
ncbi:hypothetical protein [Microvirgula aerodenitrificans]|uniref:hypothetical protein n=1 Tax=Microvirgula aerodenitrificans TaxID=57480 RepID=UPI002F41EE97